MILLILIILKFDIRRSYLSRDNSKKEKKVKKDFWCRKKDIKTLSVWNNQGNMLGKRKRDVTVASRDRAAVDKDESTHDISSQDAQERLRKYFESRFEPLDLPVSNPGGVQDGSSDAPDTDISDEDDWDGIEDGEEEEDCEPAPEVVDYSTAPIQRTEVIDKATARKYMVSYAPFSNILSNT